MNSKQVHLALLVSGLAIRASSGWWPNDRLNWLMETIPAMFARELLLRTWPLRSGKWLFTVCAALVLAISAAYELFEWQYAVIFGGQSRLTTFSAAKVTFGTPRRTCSCPCAER